MKEQNLVRCQRPSHKYKKAKQEHIAIPNTLERQFAVIKPIKFSVVISTLFGRESVGVILPLLWFFCAETSRLGNASLTRYEVSSESAHRST